MEFPITVESQEQFDGFVKDRLDRQKRTIDDLTARAETAEGALQSVTQERDAAVARATDAESKVTEYEGEKQVSQWRTEVANATGVPAGILRGSTKEEFEAHANELKPLLTAQEAPVIPNQGLTPETPAAADSDRAFADFLTGRSAD